MRPIRKLVYTTYLLQLLEDGRAAGLPATYVKGVLTPIFGINFIAQFAFFAQQNSLAEK